MNHNTLTPHTNPEDHASDFAAWEAELSTPDTTAAVIETQESPTESLEHIVDSPVETVDVQAERIGRHTAGEGRESVADLIARKTAETPSTDTIDTPMSDPENESTKELAKIILRRLGRSAATPYRKGVDAVKSKTTDFFEAGNTRFDAFLKAGEARFTPPATREDEVPELDSQDIDAVEDQEGMLYKRSSKAIDSIANLVDNNHAGSRRYKAADALFDYAQKVENRDGTYLSRGAEKMRKFDQWANDREGWVADKIKEKAAEARESRKNRIKKQRLRTIGRKLVAYHRAGKEAARDIKRPDHQDNFDLAG